MAEATRSFPKFSFRAIVVGPFFAALWLGLWRQLSGEWSVNDQYSYGWFVPVFAIVLFWLRWEDRPQAEMRNANRESRTDNGQPITDNAAPAAAVNSPWSVVIVVVALLLLFPIRLFEIPNPDWRP